jgi:hypothetical protein
MPRKPKSKTIWSRIRRKAPKVPNITCPAIDDLQKIIADHHDREKLINLRRCKSMVNRLEKLRVANEQLRESGIYWHDVCKDIIKKDRD